jgi:hypothetical protein
MMPPKETRCAEGRGRPEGETREVARGRTQSRVILPSNLARVCEAARRNKSTTITALLHHVDVDALGARFAASSGAPRREWMEERWRAVKRISRKTSNDFITEIHYGRYRQPVQRVYIPKPDGG